MAWFWNRQSEKKGAAGEVVDLAKTGVAGFALIKSRGQAEAAVKAGHLIKIFLLPVELGGQEIPQNVTYVPSFVKSLMDSSTEQLIALAEKNLVATVSFEPEYRGDSFIPAKIVISAGLKDQPPVYTYELNVW